MTARKDAKTIKPPRRTKSGRVAKPPRPDSEAAIKAVVLAQPHRKGNTDQRCADALGRFCMAHGLPEAIYTSGNRYAELVRSHRAAKGIPSQVTSAPQGSGNGPSPETVVEWAHRLMQIHIELGKGASGRNEELHAVRRITVEGEYPDYTAEAVTRDGLCILAVAMGGISKAEVKDWDQIYRPSVVRSLIPA